MVISQILDAHDWSETRLAEVAGFNRSVLNHQMSSRRPVRAHHIVKYLSVLDHDERPKLVAAWLRDLLPAEVVQDLLDVAGESLSLDMKKWTPKLDERNKKMLAWWAREIMRDGELEEFFVYLTTTIGYRTGRTGLPGKPLMEHPPRIADSSLMVWCSGADDKGSCTFVNEAWCKTTGWPPEAALGEGWRKLVHPNDLEPTFAAYAKAYEKRKPVAAVFRLKHKDGKYIKLSGQSAPRYDTNGKFAGYLGTAVPI